MVPQNCSVSHMIVSLSMYCPWYIQNNWYWIELVIESNRKLVSVDRIVKFVETQP